jgi:Fe-S-cluster-containing dehydrogenase component
MKQWYIVIDVATCHDCNNCFMACKDEHVDNEWPAVTAPQPRHGHRWINVERRERGQYPRIDVAYRPTPCQHCDNAPCVKASKGAIVRREDGIVLIDTQKAKGNKALLETCPYGVIYWNEEANVAQKCTMCAHLLDDASWLPAVTRCVHTCPTGCLTQYKMEPAEMAEMIKAEGLAALKPELGTNPHVLYKNLHRFENNFITAGVLVNVDCYENATVILKSQNGGIVCKPSGPGVAQCEDSSVLDTQTTDCFGEFKFDGLQNGDYIVEIEATGKTATLNVKIENESKNLGFIKM